MKFITIKPSRLRHCFHCFMCEPRATWFWKWKHSELALLSIVWEWWKCMAKFHFQTNSRCLCHTALIVSDTIKSAVKAALKSTLKRRTRIPSISRLRLRSWKKSPWRRINCRAPKKEIQSESDPKQHRLSVKLTSIIFDYQTRVNHEFSSTRFLVYGPRSDLLKAH